MKLRAIERKWKDIWSLNPVKPSSSSIPSTSTPEKRKKYILAQFPYPSGSLHMGHARVYSMSDCLARAYRLRGYKVLHPMGWDAFGLPAENAARDRGVDPGEWTENNVRQMRAQMDNLGLAFDWLNELTTSTQGYYRWTQWMFTRMFDKGLAYQKEALVNWDPVDRTVLADEQVDAQGRSWRSGALVEKKLLKQWFLKITDYADRLLDDLDTLHGWPESVKQMQKEWIGREYGVELDFYSSRAINNRVSVFVVHPELLANNHVTAVRLPKSHVLAGHIRWVRNPLNMAQEIPIVVDPDIDSCKIDYALKDLPKPDIKNEHMQKRYRLKDWLVSRQRKWGTPIPIKHCLTHGPVDSQHITCPTCQSHLRPETDTMDTFVDSSWYYLRFCDPHNANMIFTPEAVKEWMPVSVYIGGVEHAVMHLLYARFVHKFLLDELNLNGVIQCEPFENLICQGLVMGRTFKCPKTDRYLRPGEYTEEETSGVQIPILDGHPAKISWEKMSKSKHNGVDPSLLIEKYGADAVRLNILFKAPPEYPLYWDERDVIGQHRWLNRLLMLSESMISDTAQVDAKQIGKDEELLKHLNETIEQVTRELSEERAAFHTSIAALMKLSNRLVKFPRGSSVFKRALGALAVMLYPFAPHTAAEIYEKSTGGDIARARWPEVMESQHPKLTCYSVQSNGKLLGRLHLPVDSAQEYVMLRAADTYPLPKASRIVFIPNRVINYCST